MPLLNTLGRVALDLFFPPACALCGCDGTLLCDGCTGALPRADGERCRNCGVPAFKAAVCRHCRESPPRFSSLRAAFTMDAGARDLVHALKYEGLTSLAPAMAGLMAPTLDVADGDLIVPVPLHPRRERSRGYNQAALLARELAALIGIGCDPKAVRRVRDTAPLASGMHREERRVAMVGAFAAKRERVAGRRIVLVDDVATTGATLSSCAGALLDGGAASVRCITFARAG